MSDSSPSVSPHLLFIYLFVLHGVIQAALAASARPHDRVWSQLKLQEVNLQTLRRYVKDAAVSLGRNPPKDSCISALLDQVFPVAPWFCRT